MGLPTLSLTFILSLSKLRARREIDFLWNKGLTQKNPLSFTVPLYSPKSKSTTELLGLTIKNPGAKITARPIAKKKIRPTCAVPARIPVANNTNSTTTITYPDTGEYLLSLDVVFSVFI